MAAISLDPTLTLRISKEPHQHRAVIEEIEGLIRVYKDGHVERPQIVPSVTSALAPEINLVSEDVIIDKCTNIWGRLYVPKGKTNLPLIVYFHGGGFCVGSAAWSCYHHFLAQLSARADCMILSVNYRLAPEHPLPIAYEDGFKALLWIKQQTLCGSSQWWTKNINFSRIFLAGDSAGANIAHNVAISSEPFDLTGMILIQPFFGGEKRTYSEKNNIQPQRSALTLSTADTYWRLALPSRANRDHPFCNPMADRNSLKELRIRLALVCIAENDILRDRNLEYCVSLGKKVEHVVYKGVGHAFHVLGKTQLSQVRTLEMMSHIKDFIWR